MLHWQTEKEGIAVLSWKNPLAQSTTLDFFKALAEALNALSQDAALKGIVLTNQENDFLVGPAPRELYELDTEEKALAWYSEIEGILSKIETNGKPVVAGIFGSALGIGYELCLACHYRIAIDSEALRLGFYDKPWLPSFMAGATQRLPRLIGLKPVLPYLLERKKATVQAAQKEGLIDAVVSSELLLSTAKNWILNTADFQKPWYKKGFKMPGGEIQTPHNLQLLSSVNALVHQKTMGHYAIEANTISALYEGLQASFSQGLARESQYFVKAVCAPEARYATRTLCIYRDAAKKLAKKPLSDAKTTFKHLGIVGSGMMGSGIALVAAEAGLRVSLLDKTVALAEKGKAYAAHYWEKNVQKGKMSETAAKGALNFLRTTDQFDSLSDCDVVIEAVTENRAIKESVFKSIEKTINEKTLIASNTSTLPISSLAQYLEVPFRFIGLHFFSPVERMELLEMIRGEKTTESTIAAAFDFAKQLRKVPILVNDGRGFYTSRVFKTYLLEGFRMLAEGVAPALIENSGRLAGMPVGPLALADEVGIDLIAHILKQTKEDLGDAYELFSEDKVVGKMVITLHRAGRKSGAGFYDYPIDASKSLWSGLKEHYKEAAKQPTVIEVQQRLMCIQAVEALRCLEEKIVLSPEDADLGSVLGWGFPAFTGGVISYIDYLGRAQFIETTNRLQKQFGDRFELPQ